jgi:predicted transcriptional regulator
MKGITKMTENKDRRITIRTKQDIYDKVSYIAEKEDRSMTKVIVRLIEEEYKRAKRRKD